MALRRRDLENLSADLSNCVRISTPAQEFSARAYRSPTFVRASHAGPLETPGRWRPFARLPVCRRRDVGQRKCVSAVTIRERVAPTTGRTITSQGSYGAT